LALAAAAICVHDGRQLGHTTDAPNGKDPRHTVRHELQIAVGTRMTALFDEEGLDVEVDVDVEVHVDEEEEEEEEVEAAVDECMDDEELDAEV